MSGPSSIGLPACSKINSHIFSSHFRSALPTTDGTQLFLLHPLCHFLLVLDEDRVMLQAMRMRRMLKLASINTSPDEEQIAHLVSESLKLHMLLWARRRRLLILDDFIDVFHEDFKLLVHNLRAFLLADQLWSYHSELLHLLQYHLIILVFVG